MTLLSQTKSVSVFSDNLNKAMIDAGLSAYKVALECRMDSALLYRILKGERGASDDVIERLGGFSDLGLDVNTLKMWRLTDEYPEEVLEILIEERLRRRSSHQGSHPQEF